MVGILRLLPLLLVATYVSSEALSDAEILKIFDSIETASVASAAKITSLSAKGAAATTENANTFLNTFKHVGSANARLLSKQSSIALQASKLMLATDDTDKSSAGARLLNYKAPAAYCPNVMPRCEAEYPYRYPDGSCNNLAYPWWGKSETPFNRFLKPDYDDYVNEPRQRGVNGDALPNPRVIALNVHYPIDKYEDKDIEWTNLLPLFGQFIDHDISLTGSTSETYDSDKPLQCSCDSQNPDCLKFAIPYGDEYNYDSQCMATPRSASSYATFNCKLGRREQINLVTAWLDLNQVYGSSAEDSDNVRAFKNGLLRTSKGDGHGEYMPLNAEKTNYKAGDVRSNENVLLQSIQTMMLREHNRIANALKKINPSWEDERLFQETRVILISEFQHIIFNEYLPQIIGWDWAKDADLLPYYGDAYFNGYDDSTYVNTLNEFSTAAYRCHSLVAEEFSLRTDYNKIVEVYDWHQWLTPEMGHQTEDGYNQLLRGCTWDPMSKIDGHVNEGLFNHIAEVKKPSYLDTFMRLSMPAITILRGRDHGIRPYNDYRAECGLRPAYSFDDLLSEMNQEDVDNLRVTYDSVDDIDLWTGGVLERPVKGGVVGPTFACIITSQFRALKFGDRFYYENGQDAETRLTLPQLSQIKKTSMARLMCDNVDITYIQPDPFRLPLPEYNPLLRCDEIPGVDLNLWREATY